MIVFKKTVAFLMVASLLLIAACSDQSQSQSSSVADISLADTPSMTSEIETINESIAIEYSPELLKEERNSITIGKLSSEHFYFQEAVALDPECTEYITEISIYDKEIDSMFVVHVSLPPEYDSNKKYPMIVMTDGIWRLSDHPELREMMVDDLIEDVILVSIGYPVDYHYRNTRERDLVEKPAGFLHFIVDNLVPFLCEEYSVDSDNLALTGHSYGGYWALYSIFNNDTIGKNTFKNYFVMSPSFQAMTGQKNVKNFEEEYYSRNKSLNCNVYITVGSGEVARLREPLDEFAALVQTRQYSGLMLTYEVYDGLLHDNVFKPSIRKALLMFYGKNAE